MYYTGVFKERRRHFTFVYIIEPDQHLFQNRRKTSDAQGSEKITRNSSVNLIFGIGRKYITLNEGKEKIKGSP